MKVPIVMTSSLAEDRRREAQSPKFMWWLLGSVLLHSLIVGGFLIRSLFVKPPEPIKPDIQFTLVDPSKLDIPPDTDLTSNSNTINRGKRNPNLPPSAGSPAQSQAAPPPSRPKPQPKPVAPPPPVVPPPVRVQAPPPPVVKPVPAPPQPAPPPAPQKAPALAMATPPPKPDPTRTPEPAAPVETPVPAPPAPAETPAPKVAKAPAPPQQTTRQSDSSQLGDPIPTAPQTRQSDSSQLGGPIAANPGAGSGSSGSGSSGLGAGGLGSSGLANPSADGPPGLNSVATRVNVDWGPWLARLQRRVEQNWIPGQSGASRRTIVLFTVGRNGQLFSPPRLSRTSGSQQTDDAALSAIQRASPFDALPADYKGDSVQINFTFDINVMGEMDGGGAMRN